MPDDPLGQVLQLVAEGRLSAEEAAPIIEALDAGARATAAADDAVRRGARAAVAWGGAPGASSPPPGPSAGPDPMPPGQPRFARVEVRDGGRTSVNLRVPLALGRQALGLIPGLSLRQVAEINEAVSRGLSGPIVDIQDDAGDGVRIVLE
jgi:hypothetical protein